MVKLCVAKNYANKGIDTEKKYYVTDPHGSVVQLTDENGKVTKTYEYDSFGNEVKPDKKDENPFRYCGEYYDKETEEVYLRARYYQPKMGRFLTRDTYTGEEDEPESLHLYTYCEGDGVNQIDPSGHFGQERNEKNWENDHVMYWYTHQNITDQALSKSGVPMDYKNRSLLLYGSILMDYYPKGVKGGKYDYIITKRGKKAARKIIKIISRKLTKKYKNKKEKKKGQKKELGYYFHGKNKEKMKTLVKKIQKMVRRKKNKKESYILLGIALHSIQDYYAHCRGKYDLEQFRKKLAKFKKNHKYTDIEDLKRQMLKSKKFTEEEVIFHEDWLEDDKEERKNKHINNKDNPLKVFHKTGNGGYKWDSVSSRYSNPRYLNAINHSASYLRGTFW